MGQISFRPLYSITYNTKFFDDIETELLLQVSMIIRLIMLYCMCYPKKKLYHRNCSCTKKFSIYYFANIHNLFTYTHDITVLTNTQGRGIILRVERLIDITQLV